MLLEPQDVERFFRLYRTLMLFVNQSVKVIPDDLTTPEEFGEVSPEVRLRISHALLANFDLIELFVAENAARLSDDELDIVRSWRYLVAGKFYVFRELKKYTVFLSTDKQPIAYGVLALSQPFEDLIGPYLPVLTQTVLLPFKDKIVYDGLMTSYRISFGPGIRRSLNESFRQAKMRHGIVTSLPMLGKPMALAANSPKAKPLPKTRPPKEETADVAKAIVGMIDQFCRGLVGVRLGLFVFLEFGKKIRGESLRRRTWTRQR